MHVLEWYQKVGRNIGIAVLECEQSEDRLRTKKSSRKERKKEYVRKKCTRNIDPLDCGGFGNEQFTIWTVVLPTLQYTQRKAINKCRVQCKWTTERHGRCGVTEIGLSSPAE
jgi:hypothetical protein